MIIDPMIIEPLIYYRIHLDLDLPHTHTHSTNQGYIVWSPDLYTTDMQKAGLSRNFLIQTKPCKACPYLVCHFAIEVMHRKSERRYAHATDASPTRKRC